MGVDDTQPLITHLIELRKRLINSILAILVIFLALVYFANDIYQLVSAPLIRQMPVGATMIATDVASPFFTPIKLTFMVSIILSVPVILYQVWAFVAPALYKHERRLVMPLLVSSTLLFYIGMAFAYFVVFPLAFGFLTHAAPEGVQVSTDIRSYLDFVMALFIAFGVSFEVPVAIVLLCWMGVTTPDDLRKKRPYV
ncbi:twin-arginine translocase subunit TatC, partial [Klebsiella michiganensis]